MSQLKLNEIADAVGVDPKKYECSSELIFKRYLLDYLERKGMHKTAATFVREANVPEAPPLDIDSGLLAEWWEIFFDPYFSKPKESSSREMPSASTKGKEIQFQQHPAPGNSLNQNYSARSSACGTDIDILPQFNRHSIQDRDHVTSEVAPNGVPCHGVTRQTFHNIQKFQDLEHIQNLGSPQNIQILESMQNLQNIENMPNTQNIHGAGELFSEDAFASSLLQGLDQIGANLDPSAFELQAPSMQQELSAKHPAFARGNVLHPLVGSGSSHPDNAVQLSGKKGKQIQNDRLHPGQQKQSDYGPYSRSAEGKNGGNRGSSSSSLPQQSAPSNQDKHKGWGVAKVGSLNVSKDKVLCVDFSSDGNLLACAGHDKNVLFWNMVDFTHFMSEEPHHGYVTDLRFSPKPNMFATSSLDRAIRIWDTEKSKKSVSKLLGHSDQVTSLDFHPKKIDFVSSCDRNGHIKLWDVKKKNCLSTFEGATRRIRFQPQEGKLLAGAAGNVVNVFDIMTGQLSSTLFGHRDDVCSICWDTSGKYVATVSEDCVIVWQSSSADKYLHKLQYKGSSVEKRFQSCIFLPGHELRLVIGGVKNLELWSPAERNETRLIQAHGDLVAELAYSPNDGYIASASHDHLVNLWKEC